MELVVGTGGYTLFAHETLLRRNSSFLQEALDKKPIEGQTHKVYLPDHDPDVVYAYIQWLYSRCFSSDITHDADGYPIFHKLASLYVLGVKLLDRDFQDNVLNAMISHGRENRDYPPVIAINIIYESTSEDSPARQMLIDSWVAEGEGHWVDAFDKKSGAVHSDFKDDLIRALLAWKTAPVKKRPQYSWLESGVPCRYHQHGDDEPCTARDI